jgi:hypothetical protein
MRGIGRFDQRGSISDALKQGVATFGFGELAGKIPGTEKYFGKGMEGAKALAGDVRTKAGSLFEGGEKVSKDKILETTKTEGTKGIREVANVADKVFEKAPAILKDLPSEVKQKLLVGGVTSGVSALYSFFTGEFEPQQPGETVPEYMARRRERVKAQVRQTMDSYYTPLRNPEYAAMSDEQKDNFIDGIVGQGLAAGGMPTGIMRTNKAGVMERDYRDEGGFVPVGIKEKADDVPAMLSKNEFVFTADAVRGAGGGSIEKGAQRMYNTMKNLEKRVV